jgi:hypothetical protein
MKSLIVHSLTMKEYDNGRLTFIFEQLQHLNVAKSLTYS